MSTTSPAAEMRGRIKEDDSSVPAADGEFAYFANYREGGQHPAIWREPRRHSPLCSRVYDRLPTNASGA